jgi:hypothetical protein
MAVLLMVEHQQLLPLSLFDLARSPHNQSIAWRASRHSFGIVSSLLMPQNRPCAEASCILLRFHLGTRQE